MAESNVEEFKTKIQKDEETLKLKVLSYFDGYITPDNLIWELVPDYFVYKLPHLKINSVTIKTNTSGDRIDFSLFVIDYLPFVVIVSICEVFDTILRTSSTKWESASYSLENIAQVSSAISLVKYTITSVNYSGSRLAQGNVHKLRNLL